MAWSDTTANSIEQEVGPQARVIIWAAKQKTRVDGTYEIHFGKRYYGHNIWYVNGWIDGQTKGQPWDFKSTQENANCG